VQRRSITGDLRVIRTYEFTEGKANKLPLPLYVFRHDDDPIVPEESSTDAWSSFTKEEFEVFSLEDTEDTEALASMGHGFAQSAPASMLHSMQRIMRKYQINKDVDSGSDNSVLPSLGKTDGDLPEKCDALVVGAGITGACSCRAFVQQSGGKIQPIVVDKYNAVGGIWRYYANIYSRVNTSEVGYRIMDQTGPTMRPNQDHSPTHDILRDIYTLYKEFAYDSVYLGWEVTKCEKQPDDTYVVQLQKVGDTSIKRTLRTPIVAFGVNRRIGKRRDVNFPMENIFRGEIVYGYANEMRNLDFWGKRTIVVGAGAFAYENLRTAMEHGAKHCTILGRRAGTTCPKWIDYIAFGRTLDAFYNTNKSGNMISFQVWQNCFIDALLPQPECWKEGLLKPDGHTISVSDLAFIGGFHGMVDLLVGEIKTFRKDGQSVELKDGSIRAVDIIIKCTGFLLNHDVPQITGNTKIHANNFLDFNLSYMAEPLLDGAQFGSAKGMQSVEGLDNKYVDEMVQKNWHKIMNYPDWLRDILTPRANPFGSGYAGGMMASQEYVAWLACHPDDQKQAMEWWSRPVLDTVKMWASHGSVGHGENLKAMMTKLWEAEAEAEKANGAQGTGGYLAGDAE
jgi:hypothetical protein